MSLKDIIVTVKRNQIFSRLQGKHNILEKSRDCRCTKQEEVTVRSWKADRRVAKRYKHKDLCLSKYISVGTNPTTFVPRL